MFKRLFKGMNSSAFLLGPRGTGTSTWIKHHFPNAITFYLFPFVSKEVGFDFDMERQITYGMLPLSFLSEKD